MNQKAASSKNRVEYRETVDRNFITLRESVKEFMLEPSQLDGLSKQLRRSPYEPEASITVYNRKDVQNRALEIWGSLENLEREKAKRDHKKQIEEQDIYETKKCLRNARRTEGNENCAVATSTETEKSKNESLIIALALLVDIINLIFKITVWFQTRSDSILAEAIHSLADALNQAILIVGVYQISQKANSKHPYGYSNMMYVVSLISGVGIFCLGGAVSVFNGVISLTGRTYDLIFKDIEWAFAVLAFSAITDFVCLSCTIVAISKDARAHNFPCCYYAFNGMEPGLTVILLEDSAAVLGNLIAISMLAVSWKTEDIIPDAMGSVGIGILLGIVAMFLIVTNAAALVGRSIGEARLNEINRVLESDVMIRGIFDVKGIDMGNNLVRYKAEIDFDGAELTRFYLGKMGMNALLEEVKKIATVDDLEAFMVTQGEAIVDMIGGEIDRIELKVRSIFPEIRHVDLELL